MTTRLSLTVALIPLIILASLVYSVVFLFVGDRLFEDSIKTMYAETGVSICNAVGSSIDMDKIDGWLTMTAEEAARDAAYAESLAFMETIAGNYDVSYLLVFQAREDGEHYVFDATQGGERFLLGDTYTWAEDDLPPNIESAMRLGERDIPAYTERAHFSAAPRILSIIRGFPGADGTTKAYVATCFNLSKLTTLGSRYTAVRLGAALALTVFLCLAYILVMRRAVVRPINELTRNIETYIVENLGQDLPATSAGRDIRNEVHLLQHSVYGLEHSMREYKRKLRTARRKAETDELTGLFKRENLTRATNDYIEEAEARHHTACAFMMVDIDYFKSVNDTFGHGQGDEIICRVAHTLRGHFRLSGDGDVVARLGGDEFAVFCKGLGSAPVLRQKLKALHEAVAQIRLPNGEPLTLSIGVAVADGDLSGLTYGKLYETADEALYTVKRLGRDGHKLLFVQPSGGR